MENPARELESIVCTLTQGTPEEQHDTIYRYFAPGATFEHPFCRVPSFKKLRVPGVGELDSRVLIAAIYRWYKILSPRISLKIESCVVDERTNIAYVKVFQIFSIWFVPFHRAPVRLVSVLHLAPGPAPSSEETITPPPPYDAAQEKRQAVQEGTKPSYAAVTTGQAAPASTSTTSSQQQQQGGEGPKRYYIQKQEDLYQVTEFVKFVALRPGAAVVGFWQLIATLMCLVGAVLLSPLVRAPWQAVRAPWPAAGAVKEKAMKAKTT